MGARRYVDELRWSLVFRHRSPQVLATYNVPGHVTCSRATFRTRALARSFQRELRAHGMRTVLVQVRVIVEAVR